MSKYHHRVWHGTIVVGDYLYIDGGELTTWNGTGNGYIGINSFYESNGNIVTAPDNRTYSIDLTSSWTNKTVSINSIYKAAQIYNDAALWPDASGRSFYSYDGGYSFSIPVVNRTTNGLARFTPDGSSGSWSLVSNPASSNFSSLTRVMGASYGYGNGLGFALGGRETTGTNSLLAPMAVLAPGLVIYDSSSNNWFNLSSTGYSSTGFASRGSLQFLPQFGTKGLLLSVGGDANVPDEYVPLNSITMYNLATQEWALQKTSGEPPMPSRNLCAVGVLGDEDTYEIFVYGGWQKLEVKSDSAFQATVNNGAVYVLTLPAFHWIKQTSPITFPRYGHGCNVVGNSQMVVAGGAPVASNLTLESIPPDPWQNGIGIFNLTAMEWSGEYDPHAPAYVSPSVVKEYYRTNSRYPEWSSDQVKGWFTRDVSNGTTTAKPHKSNTNVGAIAGGTVGGVVGLLIIGFTIWYLRRRRRRRISEPVAANMAELGSTTRASEPPAVDQPRMEIGEGERYEVHAKETPHEAADNALYELPQPAYELPQPAYELPHHSTSRDSK